MILNPRVFIAYFVEGEAYIRSGENHSVCVSKRKHGGNMSDLMNGLRIQRSQKFR
jgi:hypothetical protein